MILRYAQAVRVVHTILCSGAWGALGKGNRFGFPLHPFPPWRISGIEPSCASEPYRRFNTHNVWPLHPHSGCLLTFPETPRTHATSLRHRHAKLSFIAPPPAQ